MTKQSDASLYKGRPRSSRPARRAPTVVRQKTWVDGKLTTTTVISQKVVTEPVAAVVKVGTKARPPRRRPRPGNTSGVGINLARAALWDRIARCESGGNWKINTGNGYYGGLQFNGVLAFQRRRRLRPRPQASRAEQITVANRYYAKAGTAPWSCAHAA